jgi:hypothetical protein
VREILTARRLEQGEPAASYYKILRDADDDDGEHHPPVPGHRFNCNKCHDHPFERWTQDQYYQTAAYFAQVGLPARPGASGDRTIGGTAVEGAKPLFEIVVDRPRAR